MVLILGVHVCVRESGVSALYGCGVVRCGVCLCVEEGGSVHWWFSFWGIVGALGGIRGGLSVN